MKPIKTWILVSDGAHARVLLHEGVGQGIRQMSGCDFEQPTKEAEKAFSDRPGRTFDSYGAGRHSMEPSTDPVRESKKQFATMLADFLDQQLGVKAYDRLVVVSAPKTLGDLRAAFSDAVTSVVYAELAKDLTGIPSDELGKHLEDTLAV